MSITEIDKKKIESLLPHREPMLLIDKLTKIVHLKSATAIMNVKKTGFYVQGHFPGQPVMPGVLIVEAFGQAAAALTALGIDPKEYDNKLVYLMSVDKARFRNPVIPDCELHLDIEAISFLFFFYQFPFRSLFFPIFYKLFKWHGWISHNNLIILYIFNYSAASTNFNIISDN